MTPLGPKEIDHKHQGLKSESYEKTKLSNWLLDVICSFLSNKASDDTSMLSLHAVLYKL